jgi:predicted phosphodiesterase
MRLQLMSDLHLEMHADRGAGFIRSLEPAGIDVLVLAGDVMMARSYDELASVFQALARRYRHIVYVPGNHEYYRSSPDEVGANLRRLVHKIPEVVVLDNGVATVAGRRFFGGTMWFRPEPSALVHKRAMTDFAVIRDFEPWVYEQNAAFETALATRFAPGDVVVTHHLPAPESIALRFVGSPLNGFFLCDMTAYLRKLRPPLWIHGHTHVACDYRLGATRVVANPLGYPNELDSAAAFDPRFVIEI